VIECCAGACSVVIGFAPWLAMALDVMRSRTLIVASSCTCSRPDNCSGSDMSVSGVKMMSMYLLSFGVSTVNCHGCIREATMKWTGQADVDICKMVFPRMRCAYLSSRNGIFLASQFSEARF
jgi:hypothetical protein